METNAVKLVHPREEVRSRLHEYIEALHNTALHAKSDIARTRAIELLVKIADLGAMTSGPEEPIKFVQVDGKG